MSAVWDEIRKRGSECPLCRQPVDLEACGDISAAALRISAHPYPSMVSTRSERGLLHYPALRHGDLTYDVRCPMSHAPVTLFEKQL